MCGRGGVARVACMRASLCCRVTISNLNKAGWMLANLGTVSKPTNRSGAANRVSFHEDRSFSSFEPWVYE